MRPQLLASPKAIRTAVRSILAKGGKRIVMVAFVGSGADRFIPNPAGLKLVCWDKPGCTDPDAVRQLVALGADVYFSTNLHMKLYWSASAGAVLGSANLSANGFDDSGLTELAVRLPSSIVPAPRIFTQTEKRPATPALIDDLEHRTMAYRAANKGQLVFPTSSRHAAMSFQDWYASSPRKHWRLFAYDNDNLRLGKEGARRLKEKGHEEAEDYWTGDLGQSKPNRWILSVHLKPKGGDVHWSCADFRFRMTKDNPEYDAKWPYFAVQLSDYRTYGRPPFMLTRAVKAAFLDTLRSEKVTNDASGLEYAPGGRYPARLLVKVAALLSV